VAGFVAENPSVADSGALGGHDKATLAVLDTYGQKKAGDARCQRLKAGTVLVQEFGGARHTVTIMPDGFIWQEKTYSSLTASSHT
jgi:hypothetical protein